MRIKYQRKLKTILTQREESFIDTLYRGFITATILCALFFFIGQTFLNSTLTPQGAKLESLNNEKNILIENNREIAQEVARIKSISIIKEVTEEEMDLKPFAQNHIIYISNESVIAEL